MIEPLELRIAPAAMIELNEVKVLYPDIAVPGDKVLSSVEIKNSGDVKFNGFRGLHLYLSTDPALDDADLLLGELPDISLVLKPGQSKTVGVSFRLPELNLPTPDFPSGNGFLIAELRKDGSPVDTQASNGFLHQFKFGNIGLRKNVILRGADGDGTEFSFGLSGLGTGTLTVGGGVVDLSLAGTDAKSDAVVGSRRSGSSDAFITLRSITGGALDNLLMPSVDVQQNISFGGGIDTLILHDVGTPFGSDHLIELGPSLGKRVVMHEVVDMDLHFGGTLSSLTVANWTDLNGDPDLIGGTDVILGNIISKGDKKLGFPGNFAAGVDVGDDGSIHKANIDGTLVGAQWKAGFIHEIKADEMLYVDFTARDFDKLHLTGSLGTGTMGDIVNSTITITGATAVINTFDLRTTGRLQNVVINAPRTDITTIEADDWHQGTLTAVSLNKLDLSGDRKTPVRGDLDHVTIMLSGTGEDGKLDVGGIVSDTTISTSQPLSFAFGAMVRSSITATADIKSFVIEGYDLKTHPEQVFFTRSNVNAAAHTIKNVLVRNVDADPFLPAYGITADKVLNYTRRIETVKPPVWTHLVKLDTPIANIDPAGAYFLKIT